jgi:hypothetical protein
LHPPTGGELPPSPVGLLEGLEAGDAARAAAAFAADAVCAWPAAQDDELDPRGVHEGEGIAARLGSDPWLGQPHALRLCLAERGDCLLEGSILDSSGAPAQSFAASLQLDGSGLISRCLFFRAPAVEAGAGESETETDIRALIDEYFEQLQANSFEAATANFSADCLYSHPPYSPGTPRAEFRGVEQLLAGFRERGPRPVRVEIDLSLQRGAELMLEGRTLIDGTAEGPTGSFVSCAAVDGGGKIRRYVAFHARPGLDRR